MANRALDINALKILCKPSLSHFCLSLVICSFLCLFFLQYRSLFGSLEFNKLAPYVDGFSLMTYDYSSPGR